MFNTTTRMYLRPTWGPQIGHAAAVQIQSLAAVPAHYRFRLALPATLVVTAGVGAAVEAVG